MIKALLLKNWYSMRDGLKSVICILAILIFFVSCIIGSVNTGNMHKYLGTSLISFKSNIRQITFIISTVPLLCSLDVITFHSKDRLCDWNKMLYSTPAKPWHKIMADYLCTYITLFTGFIIGLILCHIILAVSSISFSYSEFLVLFKIFILVSTLIAIILPMYTAFDEQGATSLLMALFVLLTSLIFLSQDNDGNFTTFGNHLRSIISTFDKYLFIIVAITSGIIIISYILSVNIEKRRRFRLC